MCINCILHTLLFFLYIFQPLDDFANAQRKCEVAKCKSDLSSGADEKQYKLLVSKRLKNKKKTLFNSSSESGKI